MAGRRPRPFGRTVAYLVVFFLLASIAVGFFRNPFADRWVGDVYRTDASGVLNTKIEGVQVRMDIVGSAAASSHWLSTSTPKGVRYVFTGPNREEMLKYGFKSEHLADDQGRAHANFEYGYCAFSGGDMSYRSVRLPAPPKINRLYTVGAQLVSRWSDCPTTLNVGIQQFDQMSFLAGNKLQIGGWLERDSLMGPIMYTIVKLRLDDWADDPSF